MLTKNSWLTYFHYARRRRSLKKLFMDPLDNQDPTLAPHAHTKKTWQATFNTQSQLEPNNSRTTLLRCGPTKEAYKQNIIIWRHRTSKAKVFKITKWPFWGLRTYQTLRKLVEKRRLHRVSWPFQIVDSNHKRHRLNYSNFHNCLVKVRSNQH